MSSDKPKDKSFRKEGGKEKSEEGPVSEDMYVLNDSGDLGSRKSVMKSLQPNLTNTDLTF